MKGRFSFRYVEGIPSIYTSARNISISAKLQKVKSLPHLPKVVTAIRALPPRIFSESDDSLILESLAISADVSLTYFVSFNFSKRTILI